MQCMRNTGRQPLEDVREYFAKDNLCFLSDFPTYLETIQLTYFAQDATGFSSPKVRGKRTSTAPILVPHSLICI